jgi:hypothetical protein
VPTTAQNKEQRGAQDWTCLRQAGSNHGALKKERTSQCPGLDLPAAGRFEPRSTKKERTSQCPGLDLPAAGRFEPRSTKKERTSQCPGLDLPAAGRFEPRSTKKRKNISVPRTGPACGRQVRTTEH